MLRTDAKSIADKAARPDGATHPRPQRWWPDRQAVARWVVRRRAVLGVAALAVVAAVFAFLASDRRGFFDLRVYHGAINYWVHDGGVIYDFIAPRSDYGFTYPPFAALVMSPMALVGFQVAIAVSVIMNIAATVLLLWWLVEPVARRAGWDPRLALAAALALVIAYEPMRDTVNFGQINMVLAVLVAADLFVGVSRGSRWAGVGIGLATAIKLTPGVFIIYLLVTRRFRAAAVAAGTATVATLLAAVLEPDLTRIFWAEALWNTDRVGDLSYISNQSLDGLVARLDPLAPNTLTWLILVLAATALWAWKIRRLDLTPGTDPLGDDPVGDDRLGTDPGGDDRPRLAGPGLPEATGFALTGVLGCLISPVTWVHHLVWLLPALVLMTGLAFDRESARTRRSRWPLLAVAVVGYLVLCSRLVWEFDKDFAPPVHWLLSNAYVWVAVALLVALPVRRPTRAVGPTR